jgi:glyoxylase-like metal-dependent hydrolase (beta-lactamase superfamily II)
MRGRACEDDRVIIETSTNEAYRSNCYLVADRPGGSAVVIDAGRPVERIVAAAERHRVVPTCVLLTHHHGDHVDGLATLAARWPRVRVLIHPLELDLVPAANETVEAGARIEVGELTIRPLHTPGHTKGMLSFLVEHEGSAAVFTGDTLFRDSVGGVRAPGHDTYQALKDSIMGTLMELGRDVDVRPGHSDPTTIGREWEHNPFIRIWRGLDRESNDPCVALGDPATLILLAPDYDGGHKAWVRWPDGTNDIVPGSRVERVG